MTKIHCVLIGCLLALSMNVRLEAAVRVAVLEVDPKRTDATVALLLPKLTEGNRFAVVERQQIDKILREQQLSAMLGPKAVIGRIAIGKILQADLLVFVRPAETGQQSHFEIAISETHQGLRLIRQSVDATAGEEATAAAISGLIDLAAEKQAQKIDEIFAVPPFVSDDLGFEFNRDRGAFASIVEEVVREQKGALVVELKEAIALAKEISLTSSNDPQRPLPLYFLGRFRTEAATDGRRQQIELELRRGDQLLGATRLKDIAPEAAAAFLRDATILLLAKTKAAARQPADSRIEAGQLADRAHCMMELGSWEEALDLIEASLLLAPRQPLLDRDAVIVLTEFAGASYLRPGSPLATRPDARARVDYYRLGLEHVERYLRSEQRDAKRDYLALTKFAYCLNDMGTRLHKNSSGALVHEPDWQLYVESRDVAREMIYRVLADKARRKIVDDTTRYLLYFDDSLVDDMEWEIRKVNNDARAVARRRRRLQLLADFSYVPKEGDLLMQMLFDTFPQHNRTEFSAGEQGYEVCLRPEYIDFLNQVNKIDNDSLRQRAEERLHSSQVTRMNARAGVFDQSIKPPKPVNSPNTNIEVNFSQISLSFSGDQYNRPSGPVEGCVRVGRDIDLIRTRGGLALMKQRGVLLPIHDAKGSQPFLGSFECFDGKYIWTTGMSLIRDGAPVHKWFVVDPEEAKVVGEIEPEKLLPVAYRSIEFTALSPGHIAIVGYFGQTFVAEIEFAPGVGAKAKVVHEFRKVGKTGDANAWRDPETIFEPGGLFTLSDTSADGHPKPAILAWRNVRLAEFATHPILIELPSGKVRALDEGFRYNFMPRELAACQGAVYMIDYLESRTVLRRIGISAVTERLAGPHFGSVVALFECDGYLHCIDDEGRATRPPDYPTADPTWSVAALDAGSFRTMKINLPPEARSVSAFPSAHFGLLARIYRKSDDPFDREVKAYQVRFSKSLSELGLKPN